MFLDYLIYSIGVLAIIGVSIGVYCLDRFTKFKEIKHWKKQLIFGLIFGALAICGTHFGTALEDANGNLLANINARDASVIIGGLCFGWEAGIIAGLIGGIERFVGVYIPFLKLGSFTQIACSVSTIIAGLVSAFIRKIMFDDKRPNMVAGFFAGFVIETFHLFMVFVCQISDHVKAFEVVKICTAPMLIANSVAVLITILVINVIEKGKKAFKKPDWSNLTMRTQLYLGILVAFAFVLSTIFVAIFETKMGQKLGQDDAAQIQIYLNTFLEIIVFGMVFCMLYILVKKLIIENLEKTNKSLKEITNGNLDTVVPHNEITEFNSLALGINHTVDALKGYIDEANKRIDEELAFAKSIQTSSLPSVFPAYPDRSEFDIYAEMHTAKEVGGDFYDFYFSRNDVFNFVIADVSGKGIPAALFMMRAKQALKSLSDTNMPINEVFEKGNNNLCEGNNAGMFVTAWQGTINLTTGILSFANGGHNPPLIKRKDGTFEFLRTKPNMVLAAMNGMKYIRNEIKLEKGDMLFLYTDGVTEAVNEKGEQYGEERLLKVLNNSKAKDCKELCKDVRYNLNRFTREADQFDDITMVSFKYLG